MNDRDDQYVVAEFEALRAEILNRSDGGASQYTFQITSVAAIFAFVVSNPKHFDLLLIVPYSSYSFMLRYAILMGGQRAIAKYIETELSPKSGGNLEWEKWRLTESQIFKTPLFVSASTAAFVLPAMAALFWVAYGILDRTGVNPLITVSEWVIWLLGSILTVSAQLVSQQTFRFGGFHFRRPW